MIERIPMSSADLDESDVEAVMSVLRSGRLALGPKSAEFEQLMADYIGVKHAIAVSSGTAALHLIVKSLGIGLDAEVLVPSFTFAASINAFLYEGARPVFVEIEPETYNLDPADLERKITPRTRAIMAVDVFGHPAEWDDILSIADRHGLKVIDDSCEALGADYRGRKVGRFGDAAAFAFYPNKQMTTGEGGIIVTNDDEVARLSRSLSNQGRGEMGAWLEHPRLGYNYRLDEMSAALGASQLRRIEEFIEKRERVARGYTERLGRFDWVRCQVVKPHARMSWFVYVVTLAEGIDRDGVMRAMEGRGIPVRGYFSPAHLQPYIRESLGAREGDLPLTERVAKRTVALPFHNNLTESQIDQVVAALEEAALNSAEC
ncbi:MAG TPA: DegT/DnrJ/EryC1/StrS family aminotransferase [Blastocatellia bacterium]|nr:DegT/DnrJ/EryC1/StrS family aminotransferase [Blastocatellia bacterium]